MSLRSLVVVISIPLIMFSLAWGRVLPAVQGAAPHRAAGQRGVILAIHGRGNRTTRKFKVPSLWALRWQYSCKNTGKKGRFRIVVYRHTGKPAPTKEVNQYGWAGHGIRRLHTGGKLYLAIRSKCLWRLMVSRAAFPRPYPAPTPHSTFTPTPTARPAPSPTTAANTLAIRVAGNHLVNGQGQAIRLIGVNVPASATCIPTGPHTPGGVFFMPSASQSATAIATWHANVVRITMNEDCWLGINGGNPAYTGSNYRNAIESFVALLHTHGIYVILDLHTNAPGGTPATSQQVMPDADHAIAYWTSVATSFKSDPAVIFEPYNEPHITSLNAQTADPWQCWRDGCVVREVDQFHNTPIAGAASWQGTGMQSLVNAIRATGATNPILIDGLNWSEDLTQLLQYLPTDPQHQLIADYHNYMSGTSRNNLAYWNSVIAPVAAQLPLVTSEFGEKDCQSNFVTQYMQWADQHDVSYVAWVWIPWPCSGLGLISDWSGTPSEYGRAIYDHFHAIGFTLNGVSKGARS